MSDESPKEEVETVAASTDETPSDNSTYDAQYIEKVEQKVLDLQEEAAKMEQIVKEMAQTHGKTAHRMSSFNSDTDFNIIFPTKLNDFFFYIQFQLPQRRKNQRMKDLFMLGM